MPVLLLHQTIVAADAIGHDLLAMYALLNRRYGAFIFGENVELPGVKVLSFPEAQQLIRQPGTVTLYHHSIHWPLGEELLEQAGGPLFIRYHNVTPPEFFSESQEAWSRCAAGRAQTHRFASRFPAALWLPASLYSLRESGLDSMVRYKVVPPFAAISDQRDIGIDEALLRRLLKARELQLLFVSRMAPHKGHGLLVEVVSEYRTRYGPDVRLFLAGKRDESCPGYFGSVMSAIAAHGLEANVEYLGAVPQQQLAAYFLGCDAYVCCSEHEGFSVPIVEAQSLSLPVVARAKGAVPETLGSTQLLFHDHPGPYADALHRLRTDTPFRRGITAAGRRNVAERFAAEKLEAALLESVAEHLEPAA